MKLRIPTKIAQQWITHLTKASSCEIGGILFGEQLAEGDFRIVEITTQARKGCPSTFRRDHKNAISALNKFCSQYGNNHQRFNYLGEWHSHPNTEAMPSLIDQQTMLRILRDPNSIMYFLVLIITKLDQNDCLCLSATTYLRSGESIQCEIELEVNPL